MQCTKCGKRKAKDKACKFCHRARATDCSRTFVGCLRKRYRDLKAHSKAFGWPAPEFSSDEFVQRFIEDTNYLSVHASWVASGYSKWLAPSTDRIDPTIPYILPNLRMITWRLNFLKGVQNDRKVGTVAVEVSQDLYEQSLLEEIPDYL